MAEPTTFDPRIYGGNAPDNVEYNDLPIPADAAAVIAGRTAPATVPLAQTAAAGTSPLAEGQYNLAVNSRPEATFSEAAGATIKGMTPFKVGEWINKPSFPPEPGFDPRPGLKLMGITPTEDEERFITATHSYDEQHYAIKQVEDERARQALQGDHPVFSTLLSVFDPGYLMIDAATLGSATLATGLGASVRAGRAIAGVGSFAGNMALGKAEQAVSPVSDKQIIINALINGSANALVFRGGKFEPKDPSFPHTELEDIVRRQQGVVDRVEPEVSQVKAEVGSIPPTNRTSEIKGPTPDAVKMPLSKSEEATADLGAFAQPRGADVNPLSTITIATQGQKAIDRIPVQVETDGLTEMMRHQSDPKFGGLAAALMDSAGSLLSDIKVRTVAKEDLVEGGRAFYTPQTHAVYQAAGADAKVSIHELVHGLTNRKLIYGKRFPDSAHGVIRSQLEDIRVAARKQFMAEQDAPRGLADAALTKYFSGNTDEFVAGLFSGDTGFTNLLSRMPAQPGQNVLGKVVDAVRRLLGLGSTEESALTRAIGLTDDLINTHLNADMVPGTHQTRLYLAPPTGTQSQIAATIVRREDSAMGKLATKGSWSLHKTISNMGTMGKQTADLFVDNPVHMTADSVTSQQRAIRAGLSQYQSHMENAILDALKDSGYGVRQRITDPRGGLRAQATIEKEAYLELNRRYDYETRGVPVPPSQASRSAIAIADAHDQATKLALAEMKAAGVKGADGIAAISGYATRKWDITKLEELESRLARDGQTPNQIRNTMRSAIANGIQKNSGMERQVAEDIAGAIIDRTKRKGYFEDSAMGSKGSSGTATELRDILASSGIPKDRMDRAMEVVNGVADEKGKAGMLKHRIGMDLNETIQHMDGSTTSLHELLDTSLVRNLDSYLDKSAGQAALARKGMGTSTAVADMRRQFLEGVDNVGERAKAATMFDNMIAAVNGAPVGEAIPEGMRKLQAVTQMVGLASSGLWQVTEYASAMAKFGMAKTVGNMIKEMPGFRDLLGSIAKDKGAAEQLSNVLAHGSASDMRMRPYLQKMEDNFEMPRSDAVLMALQQAKQLVPYVNAMHFIHHHQSQVVANLVSDTFMRGAQGDMRALNALEKYGLESHTMGNIRADILKGGSDTAKWSDDTWAAVRGPLSKMMDDSMLRNRLGELPAFAQFSAVGKFVFTFRSFVLGSHNKILMGTLGREGVAGLGLLMAYQYPMTFLAVAAQEGMANKKTTKSVAQMAGAATGQMGSMGLFGELGGVISGDKNQFGAPGLIFLDRIYKGIGAARSGNFGTAAAGVWNATPILSIIPGSRAISETFKD